MTNPRQNGALPALIFDLDGTLVDTAPDLLAALNHVFSSLGDYELNLSQIRQMVGQGARALICEGLDHFNLEKSESEIDGLMEVFLPYYFENVCVHSKPFDGLMELLPRWRAEGHPLAVCTNKLEAPSRKLLSALQMDGFFDAIVGRDTTTAQKPDPTPLFHAIEAVGGAPDHAIFVGDSITDLKTAHAANVPLVLVSFGYTEVPARELGADVVIDHFDELGAAIKSLF
ncbi:MAG: HAD family hydrolase [Alphaproteobacteria bacterium]|nr:MAG: HAD family hydrolase [Alphaproteobacteria bacterium]